MHTLILTIGLMVVGVMTVPAAGAAPSPEPGYVMATTDAHALEAQELPDLNIEIRTDGGSKWYEQPVWVAIGVLGLLLVVVLVVMASKGGAAKT